MKNIRLLWHIFPAILVVTLLTMFFLTWYGTAAIRDFHYEQMTLDIEARARLLRPEIRRLLYQAPEQLQPFCRRLGRQASTRITVIAADGLVKADSNENPNNMDNHANRPEIKTAISGKTGSAIRFSKTLGHNRLYVAIPLEDQQNPIKHVLRLSLASSAIDEALSRIHWKIYGGVVIVVLFASVVAYWVARQISYPITKIQREAKQLANEQFVEPLDIGDYRVSSEMAGLSTTFNAMAKQVQQRIATIKRQNNELEAVFGSMMEPVMAMDSEQRILRINRAAAQLFRLDPKKIVGHSFPGLLRNQTLQVLIDAVMESNTAVVEEISIFDGMKDKQLRTRVTPLLDINQNPVGLLVVMTDMSRINRLENLRRDFVANVSHELKTPITSIKGYVETLQDGALDDRNDAEQFLQVINRQTERLNAIVDDLLTLSRIEQENEEIPLQKEQLLPILRSAVQACNHLSHEKEMDVSITCSPELEANVNDALLEQAVINLLTNAITYSPHSSPVAVSAREIVDEKGRKKIAIAVEDQGIGMEKIHLKRIFERFYRCDKARSRDCGGTGLGLAIVKHIAQSHGGNVAVDSVLGNGSTFTIFLPTIG